MFGKPDFCLKGKKIAIFSDSEFWHSKRFKKFLEGETNSDFWEEKIKRNIERVKEVNKRLESEGWTVLRFWGKDIEKNTEKCVNKVIQHI